MAVGDVVSGTSSVDFNFQPSSGIEIIIVSVFGYRSGYPSFYFGLNNSKIQFDTPLNATNIKIAINNTNYLGIEGGYTKGYTGIQIK